MQNQPKLEAVCFHSVSDISRVYSASHPKSAGSLNYIHSSENRWMDFHTFFFYLHLFHMFTHITHHTNQSFLKVSQHSAKAFTTTSIAQLPAVPLNQYQFLRHLPQNIFPSSQSKPPMVTAQLLAYDKAKWGKGREEGSKGLGVGRLGRRSGQGGWRRDQEVTGE